MVWVKDYLLRILQKKNRLVSGMAYFFWNNSRNIGTVISRFVTLPLEIHKTKPGNPQNCVKPYCEIPDDIFLIIPRDSTTFLINPWKFCSLFLQCPWKFHTLNPLNLKFLFWNSPLALAISWQTHCVRSVQIWSFIWSVFSRIQTEYGVLRSKSPYLVQMLENTDHKKIRIWTLFTQWPDYHPTATHRWYQVFHNVLYHLRLLLPFSVFNVRYNRLLTKNLTSIGQLSSVNLWASFVTVSSSCNSHCETCFP